MRIAWFLASGEAYFVGAGLVVLAALLRIALRRRAGLVLAMVLTGLGLTLILLSATPASVWAYAVWLAGVAAWIIVQVGWKQKRKMQLMLAVGVVLLSLGAAGLESPHVLSPRPPSGPYKTIYVIGDSISAGTGAPGETVWPTALAEQQGIAVVNLAVAGATARSALKQAARLPSAGGFVLVEIGGNDLLGGSDALSFENDLNALIAALRGPERAIMMVELPLPPLCNAFGAAQRRVARMYDVRLIPKRYMAGVMGSDGATVDGLHLSNEGHRRMAGMVGDVLNGSVTVTKQEPR